MNVFPSNLFEKLSKNDGIRTVTFLKETNEPNLITDQKFDLHFLNLDFVVHTVHIKRQVNSAIN